MNTNETWVRRPDPPNWWYRAIQTKSYSCLLVSLFVIIRVKLRRTSRLRSSYRSRIETSLVSGFNVKRINCGANPTGGVLLSGVAPGVTVPAFSFAEPSGSNWSETRL